MSGLNLNYRLVITRFSCGGGGKILYQNHNENVSHFNSSKSLSIKETRNCKWPPFPRGDNFGVKSEKHMYFSKKVFFSTCTSEHRSYKLSIEK